MSISHVIYCLCLLLAPIKSQTTPLRLTELAKQVSNAIDRGSKHLPHSLTTQDVLRASINHKSSDYIINAEDYKSPPKRSRGSLRGPNKPSVQRFFVSSKTILKQQQPTTMISPKDDQDTMEKSFKEFLKKGTNVIPPLEDKKVTTKLLNAFPRHRQYKTTHELAVSAMAEYDAKRSSKGTNIKNNNYMNRVASLEEAARIENGGKSEIKNEKPTGEYAPHMKHFGFNNPLDFIDSFDPFSQTVGSAPALAAAPRKYEAPPLPVDGGGAAQSDVSSLSSKILDSTPTYHYTKIGGRGSDRDGGNSLADRGIFSTNDKDAKDQLLPSDGPMGVGRQGVSQRETDRAISQMITQLRKSNPVNTNVAIGPV